MAEVEVTIQVKVDGHTFIFQGDAARGPMGNKQDTARAAEVALDRALEGRYKMRGVLDRYSRGDA